MTAARVMALTAAWVLLASQAAAQGVPYGASPPDRQKAFVAVGKACRNEAARFCADVDGLQLRNVAICLKPYMSNLSLGCRSSVRAATAPAASGGG